MEWARVSFAPPGLAHFPFRHPRLAPWAAFFRRFAACSASFAASRLALHSFAPSRLALHSFAPSRLGLDSLEFYRDRQQGGAEGSGGHDGYGAVRSSEAMNLFSVVLLAESHCAQDRGQDHSRAVNPGHGLVEADRPTSLGTGNLGSADGVVGGDSVQVAGQSA